MRAAASFGAFVFWRGGRGGRRRLERGGRRRGRADRRDPAVETEDPRGDRCWWRVHARGPRNHQVKLSLFGTALTGDIELRSRRVTARDRAHSAPCVVDAIRGLTVRVRRQPLLPARLAVTRSDLEVEVEAVTVLEAHAAFVDGLHARPAGDERDWNGERDQRRRGQAKLPGPKSPTERGHGSVACPVTRCLASAPVQARAKASPCSRVWSSARAACCGEFRGGPPSASCSRRLSASSCSGNPSR